MKYLLTFFIFLLLLGTMPSTAQRRVDKLGRGVVALRTSTTGAFISWRLLGTESRYIGFNVYRSTAGGTPVKVNTDVLYKGTNYSDAGADLTKENSYFVKPVLNGVEQTASASYSLAANTEIFTPPNGAPAMIVNLTASTYSTSEILSVTVGDLDGNGEYDFIIDRLVTGVGDVVEAYKPDGTLLWTIKMGSQSLVNRDDIKLGATVLFNGMNDGMCAYDMDGDGKAEVLIRTGNDVTFADGNKIVTDNTTQYISVIDGMTGVERTKTQIPDTYFSAGPMICQMGIGYANGITPSLFTLFKNRNADLSFNEIMCAYEYDGTTLNLKWKITKLPGEYSHQFRILDLNGDGCDDITSIGFALNGKDGSTLYSLPGIVHGDRFHVMKMDPNRKGLQGYGIQQINSSSLLEYYYDASTGEMLWKHMSPDGNTWDVGRGDAGDIDPTSEGYEVWSFSGTYNAPTNKMVNSNYTYPNFNIWWDGDVMGEHYNDETINRYRITNGTESGDRLVTCWKTHNAGKNFRNIMHFYGDILGDWREELVMRGDNQSSLVVFSSTIPSDVRLYCLAQNPEYRSCMTIKGYAQSNYVDYYLGYGMGTPPMPPIQTATCVWNGTNSNWDLFSQSWNTNTVYSQGNDVQFDISGSASTLVQISEKVSPSHINVIAATDYTLTGEGEIEGTAGLLKIGNQTLNLNVNASYSDTTRVEEGELYVNKTLSQSPVIVFGMSTLGGNGTINQTVILKDKAILSAGEKNSIGTLAFKQSLVLPSRSTINFDISNTNNDKIMIEGDLTCNATCNWVLNANNQQIKAGAYSLISYTGAFVGSLDKISVSGLVGQKCTLVDSLNQIWLKVKASRPASALVWAGTDTQWDLLTTQSWLYQGLADVFAQNDTVVFSAKGKAQPNINVVGDLIVGQINVSASNNYSVAGGSIGGQAGVTKNGNGTFSLLSTTNTFTGKTIVNEGVLEFAGLGALGFPSALGAPTSTEPSYLTLTNATLKNVATLDTYTNRGMLLQGTMDTIATDKSLVFAGTITGDAGLVKTGSGALNFMSDLTYKGNTVIKGGSFNALKPIPSATIRIENGACNLRYNDYITYAWNLEVPEGCVGSLGIGTKNTISGKLLGAGTLNLNIPYIRENISGDWSAFTGTVNVTSSYDDGTSGNVDICNFNLSNYTKGYANLDLNLGAKVYLISRANTANSNNAQTVKLGGLSGVSGAYLAEENWVIGAKNTNTVFAGIISGNALTKEGTGSLTLSGANTYTGATIVNGGKLIIDGSITSAVTVNTNATVDGKGTIANTVNVNTGTLAVGNGYGILSVNTVNMTASSKLSFDLNKATPAGEQLKSNAVTLNGTLLIANLGTAYTAGDAFTIITAPTITGAFSAIEPAQPAAGLAWDLSNISTGVLKVVASSLPYVSTSIVENKTNANVTITPNKTGRVYYSLTDQTQASLTTNAKYIDLTANVSTTIVINDLSENTAYTLYALAQSGNEYSYVSKTSFTTSSMLSATMSTVSSTAAKVIVNPNITGKIYFLQTSTQPTVNQVLAGTSINCIANTPLAFDLTSLSPSTAYKVYIVAQTDRNSAIIPLSFTTLNALPLVPTMTLNTVSQTSVKVNLTSSISGTIKVIVLNANDATPTNTSIFRQDVGALASKLITCTANTPFSVELTDLEPSGSYKVYAVVQDMYNQLSPLVSVSAITNDLNPYALAVFNKATVTEAYFDIKANVAGKLYYVVYKATETNITQDIVLNPSIVNMVNDGSGSMESLVNKYNSLYLNNLQAETNYKLYVVAQNNKGVSSAIVSVEFTTQTKPIIDLVATQTDKNDVIIYPNPATDKVTIALDKVKAELFSIDGKKVMNIDTPTFGVSQLSNGMYFLRIGNVTKKLIIRH